MDKAMLICTLAGLAAAPAAAQVVIGDFEGSDPGTWGYWSGGFNAGFAGDPTLELSTEDFTTGSSSVKASNMGYAQNLAYSADFATREAFLANSELQFDVVFPEYSESGFWEIFEIVFNSEAGFNNLTGSMTNSEGGTNQVGWGADGGPRRVVTFTVDYSSQLPLWGGTTPGYLELVFALNNDSVHNVAYIDNVRLVPTPATAGLLAIGMGAAAARRRR
jgi:hypothetical protein